MVLKYFVQFMFGSHTIFLFLTILNYIVCKTKNMIFFTFIYVLLNFSTIEDVIVLMELYAFECYKVPISLQQKVILSITI